MPEDQVSSSPLNLSLARVAVYAVAFTTIQLLSQSMSGVPLAVESVVLSAIGGVMAAWLLGTLSVQLQTSRRGKLLLLWPSLFVVQLFGDLIEGAVFTTRISSSTIFLGGTLLGAGLTLVESLAVILVFPSSSASKPLALSLLTYFSGRTWASWGLRFALGAVAYFPVYFLFGALVSPYVIPYYTDPSNGLGLVIPSFGVMIPVELLRGALFALVLLPLVGVMRFSREGTFLFLALFLFIVGAYVPFVAGTTLPWALKSMHSVEILADSVAYGAILTYLFKGRYLAALPKVS